MGSTKPPIKMQSFMYYLMKEARRSDLTEFLREIEVSESEYEEIEAWFSKYEIKI